KYIHSFLLEHPNVTMNLELTNREVDIIAEGIDLYAQIGELVDSSLISRYLTTSERVLVASPRYLEEYGEIETPRDLKTPFRMIEVVNKAARMPKWKLQLDDGTSELIELPSQLKVNT
ncbi:LysR substrate-binding domain-containing protein, partial [Vibrio breoganii]